MKKQKGWRVRRTGVINNKLTAYSVNIQQISTESLLCAKYSGYSAEQNEFPPMDVYFSGGRYKKKVININKMITFDTLYKENKQGIMIEIHHPGMG